MSEKFFEITPDIVDTIKKLIQQLPENAKELKFTILLGMESFVEYNPVSKVLKVKTTRCDFCGMCCMDLPPNSDFVPFGVDDEGKCNVLFKERDGTWKCGAGYNKPYRCLGDPMKINTPECCIEYFGD